MRLDKAMVTDVLLLLGGLIFAGSAYLYVSLPAGDSEPGETAPGMLERGAVEPGQPAPDFALSDARGGTSHIRLSDFRGKTVVLNWYASWCGPCRAELPEFERVYQQLNGEVVFLAVNLLESQGTAEDLLKSLSLTYPSVLDSTGGVAAHFAVRGLPSTFFIDANGVVFASGRGMITPEALRNELGRLGHTYE